MPETNITGPLWSYEQRSRRLGGMWPTVVTPVPPSGPTVIGQSYGGGYYAGQISTSGNNIATHYLIVAPKATGEYTGAFSTGGTSDPTSEIDGPTNSSTMNNSSHMAAQFCEGLTIGGYTDWYLPAKLELEILYYSFRPFGGTTTGGQGVNAYSVPPRPSGYTGSEAATTAAAFQSGGAEAFASQNYWSSTQLSGQPGNAWAQYFFTGTQNGVGKTESANKYARAVRRIPV